MTLRLVLNADDFGYEPAISRGIARAMREGVVSSTTMMVTGPHAADAARQAQGLSIGLHLDLVRFDSLAQPGHTFSDAGVEALDVDFVARETRAQLGRLEALLGRPATHVDVHKHAHRQPAVLEGLARVALERDLAVRSIDADMREALRRRGVGTNDAFFGDTTAEGYWTPARFEAALDVLPADGLVELMCHPGHRPTLLRSGLDVAREVELATFTDARARQALETRGLVFGPWPRPDALTPRRA